MRVLGLNFSHNAAICLIEDGKVIFAIEEERISRVKHTGPSLKWSLEHFHQSGFSLSTCDAIAANWSSSRAVSIEGISPDAIEWVPHHLAHCESAFRLSGLPSALILSIDGMGDDTSGQMIGGMVGVSNGGDIETLQVYPEFPLSLGQYYDRICEILGFRAITEPYKVMGLAPFGRPETFLELFREYVVLLPGGLYNIRKASLINALLSNGLKRERGRGVEQKHKDLAATTQLIFEEIVEHIVRAFQEQTGQHNLAIAGGCALNCKLNGRLLRSGLFDQIFVQPAANDAGGALGAALHVWRKRSGCQDLQPAMRNVFWGTDIGSKSSIEKKLLEWKSVITYRRSENICEETADRLMAGHIIGWIQGRSEFGPRALGNRSILADPRPSKNRDIVNRVIKKREGFRPFAPSVKLESVREFFDVPSHLKELPFMLFVVYVREAYRKKLGATTHIDGSSRVQTVARCVNERYWMLLDAFEKRSGFPILLNTSFNNSVEPIVDGVDDAINAFLTMGINTLVIGDFVIERKSPSVDLRYLVPEISKAFTVSIDHEDSGKVLCLKGQGSLDPPFRKTLTADSQATVKLLWNLGEGKTLDKLCREANLNEVKRAKVYADFLEIWWHRGVMMKPGPNCIKE